MATTAKVNQNKQVEKENKNIYSRKGIVVTVLVNKMELIVITYNLLHS